jgi:hypothetical protein
MERFTGAADLFHVESEFTVVIPIAVFLRDSDEFRIIWKFLLPAFVFQIVRTSSVQAGIDDIAASYVNSCELAAAVRTVEAGLVMGRYLISECVMADLAQVLPAMIVRVQVIAACAAPRTVPLVGEFLRVTYRRDALGSDDIRSTELFEWSCVDHGRLINLEGRIGSHLVLLGFTVSELVNPVKVRLQDFVDRCDLALSVLNTLRKPVVPIKEFLNRHREFLEKSKRFYFGSKYE